jgi:hypothetical protein
MVMKNWVLFLKFVAIAFALVSTNALFAGSSAPDPKCEKAGDVDAQAICNAKSTGDTDFCKDAKAKDNYNFCMGVASGNSYNCELVKSFNRKRTCLEGAKIKQRKALLGQ